MFLKLKYTVANHTLSFIKGMMLSIFLLPALAVAQDTQPIIGSSIQSLTPVTVGGISSAYEHYLSIHPQVRVEADGCHVLGDLFIDSEHSGISGRLELVAPNGQVVASTRSARNTGIYRLVVKMPAGIDSITLRERTPDWSGGFDPIVVCSRVVNQ